MRLGSDLRVTVTALDHLRLQRIATKRDRWLGFREQFHRKGGMMTERIFDGIKVIDCASFIAGPAAATVMSDFGADVIKIKPPGMGDPYRRRAVPIRS